MSSSLSWSRLSKAERVSGQYGEAVERMCTESHGVVEVVVMRYTHQARHIGSIECATYIDTYAEFRVDAEGWVTTAALRRFKP